MHKLSFSSTDHLSISYASIPSYNIFQRQLVEQPSSQARQTAASRHKPLHTSPPSIPDTARECLFYDRHPLQVAG